MSTNVTLNGSVYAIPAVGDSNWGTILSNFFISIGSNTLQKTGGAFTLTADTDFGATYGLKSNYFKSRATNPASAGSIRLGNTELIKWRNAANNADLGLTVSAANALQFDGVTLLASGLIVNADISASAAIALNKLAAITASVVPVADASGFLVASAISATTLSYLDATSSIQTQMNLKAPLASPTFSGTVTTPLSTAGPVITSSGGVLSSEATLAKARGGTGADNSSVTFPSSGSILAGTPNQYGVVLSGSAGTVSILAPDASTTKVLTSAGASANPIWADPAASPSSSFEISNLGLATSVAASALTIALKQADGSTDPAAGAGSIKIGMRSSTLTSGLYNQRSVTAATSLVISSGSTLGHISAIAHYIYVYAIDNAGTIELAVSQALYSENQLISTTAEGGAGAADSNSAIYSTTARTNVPHRVIAVLTSTQATAGTWASVPSTTHVGDYGAIAASETVAARYTTAAGQSIPNNSVTIIDYGAKDFDYQGAVTTGASWKYTAQISGLYIISGVNAIAYKGTSSVTGVFRTEVYRNGTSYAVLGARVFDITSNAYAYASGSTTIRLLAGDYVDVRAFQNSSITQNLSASTADNHINIERIGNY